MGSGQGVQPQAAPSDMKRVVAFVPDLLFGSNVAGALAAAGHETVLASDAEALRRELPGAQALVIDLTFEVPQRIELVRSLRRRQRFAQALPEDDDLPVSPGLGADCSDRGAEGVRACRRDANRNRQTVRCVAVFRR